MIKIIPTDHLMSRETIYNLIKKENPDVIAVELCLTRYNSMVMPLMNNYIDEKPKDDSLIGKISNKIREKAEKEGLQYGSDQINACIYAKENNLPLEFVDLEIIKTKELIDKIPENEKTGFLNELLEFEKKTITEQTKNIDEHKILIELKKKYPISFEFLINMRNLVIINNLLKLERRYKDKKILALLGKSHIRIVEDALE